MIDIGPAALFVELVRGVYENRIHCGRCVREDAVAHSRKPDDPESGTDHQPFLPTHEGGGNLQVREHRGPQTRQ